MPVGPELRPPRWWLIVNALVPGAGLIAAQREWLGLSLALLFGICGQIALAGRLLAPAALPPWTAWLATSLAAAVWLSAQLLLIRRQRRLFSPQHRLRIDRLFADAQDARHAGRTAEALGCLDMILELDDRHVGAWRMRAELLAISNPTAAALAHRHAAALEGVESPPNAGSK